MEAAKTDLVLVMDNAIELKKGTVGILVEALTSVPKAVAAVPRVLYRNDPTTIQYEGANCHFLGHMMLRSEDTPVASVPFSVAETQSLVSACFLFNRATWPAGRFDTAFAFYYEDHDFGLRARLAGHRLIAASRAETYHGSGTPDLSFRPGGQYSSKRVETMISGRWQMIFKNFSFRTLFVLAPILIVYECFQIAGVLKKGWWSEWWTAIRTVRRNLPALRDARKEIQVSRQMSDRCVLQGGDVPFKGELGTSRIERVSINIFNALASGYWALARRLI